MLVVDYRVDSVLSGFLTEPDNPLVEGGGEAVHVSRSRKQGVVLGDEPNRGVLGEWGGRPNAEDMEVVQGEGEEQVIEL